MGFIVIACYTVKEDMFKNDFASPSSSPPTPSSPLPISVGPGFDAYAFSPSSYGSSTPPSPPFSPISNNNENTSPETSPLLQLHTNSYNYKQSTTLSSGHQLRQPSAFSLDGAPDDDLCLHKSCLRDLLEWLLLKCCSCTKSSSPPSKPRQSNHHLFHNDFP